MSRDYLERTIATVRNHRDADNCWPSWANVFADEIERLWDVEARLRAVESLIAEVQKYRDGLPEGIVLALQDYEAVGGQHP